MKPISTELRKKIDSLRKTPIENSQPSWLLSIFRDRERMLGVIDGERITSGPPNDVQPTIAQRDDGVYFVCYSRDGTIYQMTSSATNEPKVTWGAPVALFAGEDPDLDFYGEFTTLGTFNTQELMMAYEQPAGQIQFRKRIAGVWQSPVFVANGGNPSVVRAWADPPEVGPQDQGLVIVYTQGGQLKYTHSDDEGSTWAVPIVINSPAGGTKKNAQIFRLSDYTLGIIYEYDNGMTSEVWFMKTTRKYVSIASPDDTIIARITGFMQYTFSLKEYTASNETASIFLGNYRHATFALREESSPDESASITIGGFRQTSFTGANP